jgi:hypothetical protein
MEGVVVATLTLVCFCFGGLAPQHDTNINLRSMTHYVAHDHCLNLRLGQVLCKHSPTLEQLVSQLKFLSLIF